MKEKQFIKFQYYFPKETGGFDISEIEKEGYVGKDVIVESGFLKENEYTILPNGNYYIRTKNESGFIDEEKQTLN